MSHLIHKMVAVSFTYPKWGRLLTAFAAGLALTFPVLGQTPKQKPLPIEAVLGMQELSLPIELSPDGEWVAYALRDTRMSDAVGRLGFGRPTATGVNIQSTHCILWLTHVASGRSRPLTDAGGTSWSPSWSPNGNLLAFYSDRAGKAQVWVWEKATGKLRCVSPLAIRSAPLRNPIDWTPDSRQVLVKAVSEEAENTPSGGGGTREAAMPAPAVMVYRSPAREANPQQSGTPVVTSVQARESEKTDLVLLNVINGKIKRLAKNASPSWFRVLPGGDFAAFLSERGIEENTQNWLHDLIVVPLKGSGTPRIVAKNIRHSTASGVSCSSDGKTLAYTEFGSRVSQELFLVPVSGAAPPRSASSGTPHPSFGAGIRAPVWDVAGHNVYLLAGNALWRVQAANGATTKIATLPGKELDDIAAPQNRGRFWSPDGGKSLVLTAHDVGASTSGFYKVVLDTGQTTPLWEDNVAFGDELQAMSASDDGQRFVFECESAKHHAEVWLINGSNPVPHPLTHTNPKTESYVLGESRIVEWRGAAGNTLRGALLLPSGYEKGKRYPLVVDVYGGAQMSQNVNRFGLMGNGVVDNMQLLATRGYAVLAADTVLRVGTPMKDIASGVLSGVDKIVEMGLADPDRLGIMGFSYGGYSTLAVLVQSPRFKAALCYAGTGNLIFGPHTLLPDGSSRFTGWAETGQGRMGGSLWEFRDRYIENSPLFYLDKVQTPLLIVQGTADQTMPPANGDALFMGLRRLGKEVEYAKYEGEAHGIRGYANQMDYCSRMVAWFDRFLKDTAR